MSDTNVTNHPDKNKLPPAEAAFKQILEGKKKALQEKMKKAVEEYIAAEQVLNNCITKITELEEEFKGLETSKLKK